MGDILKYNISHYEVEDFDNFLVLKSFIVSVGKNRKKTFIPKDSIEDAKPTLYNRPVYCKWVEELDDFDGHAKDNDQIINDSYVFIGHIPYNGDIKFENYEGKEFLVATTLIYKDYFPDICERIINEHPELSMEISVTEAFENEDGLLEISKFRFMSYVLLGRYNNPGIENAHVEVLQFEDNNIIDEYNAKYEETLPKYKIPLEIIDTLKNNIAKKEANIDLDFTKGLLKKEQLTFNEIVSFLDKVVNAQSDSDTKFLGGEETIRWCKQIIALSEGGQEVLKKKNEENINENVDEKDENQEDFAVNNTVALLSQVIEDEDGCFQYEDCDIDKNMVYFFDYSEWKFYAAKYELEEDKLPIINFENKERVYYGGIKWIHVEENQSVEGLRDYSVAVQYAADVVEGSVKAQKELDELKAKYDELEEEFNSVVAERDSLAEFKSNIEEQEAKDLLLADAQEIYAVYDEYMDEDAIAKFNNELMDHKDIEKLQGDVARFILPILLDEANKAKLDNGKDGINFNFSDKTGEDSDEVLKKGNFKDKLNEVYK